MRSLDIDHTSWWTGHYLDWRANRRQKDHILVADGYIAMGDYPMVVDTVAWFKAIQPGPELHVHTPLQDEDELLRGMGEGLLAGCAAHTHSSQRHLHRPLQVWTKKLIHHRRARYGELAAPVVPDHRIRAL
jgi:hypothetical protein